MATATGKAPVLPVVDFGPFLGAGATKEQRLAVGKELTDAFKNLGFVYIKNYGIPEETIRDMFAQAKWFFSRPLEEKSSIPWDVPESNRGYTGSGREKLSNLDIEGQVEKIEELRHEAPDMKESLELGRDDDPRGFKNQWIGLGTKEGDEFRKKSLEFYHLGHQLHLELMRAIALGLGLEENFFDKFCDKRDHTLRYLHYPASPVTALDSSPHSRRAGEHTDYGTVTLLFQEDSSQGGLQVRSYTKSLGSDSAPKTEFVDVPPLPGTLVVNVGDLLQRWTNDLLLSTEHRVVAPPRRSESQTHYDDRYTVVFFSNPNFDATIESIPQCVTPERPAKYGSVNSLDWLVSRLKATYN